MSRVICFLFHNRGVALTAYGQVILCLTCDRQVIPSRVDYE